MDPLTTDSGRTYRIMHRLSNEGARFSVYLAETTDAPSRVVIKRFLYDKGGCDLRSYDCEREALRLLRDRCVVRLEDTAAPSLALVLEYVPGGDLGQASHRHDPLTTLAYTAYLAGMAAELHARGLAHGDLKPGNILLSERARAHLLEPPEGKGIRDSLAQALGPRDLVFCDLEFARRLDQDTSHSTLLNGTAPCVGTPVYMAPEEVGCTYAESTDSWHIGLIGTKLLTGKLPIPQCESAIEQFVCLDTLSEDRLRLPAGSLLGAEAVLNKAFRKDYRDRPTARQLFAAFQEVLLRSDLDLRPSFDFSRVEPALP